jgi:predicted nucleotidyltransferase
MKSLSEIQLIIQAHKTELAEKFGVSEIGIFGSVVRGEAREDSDVDVLVEFNRPTGFVTFMDLLYFLEDLFGSKVDLVTRNALKPRIGKRILHEVMYV